MEKPTVKKNTLKNAVPETAINTSAADGGAGVNVILPPKAQKKTRNRIRQQLIKKAGGEFIFDIVAMVASKMLGPFESDYDGRFIFSDLERYAVNGSLNTFWDRHLDDVLEIVDVDVDGHAGDYIRKILVPLLSEKECIEYFNNERAAAKCASEHRKPGKGRKFDSYRRIGATSLWQTFVEWMINQDQFNPKQEANAGVQASNITQVSHAIKRELKPLYIPGSNACN